MSYTALYRKFRPQEFEDVKGQEHIVTTLKNKIKADRIGHAYLFCGTRGTGKTTIAKIFAKAVYRMLTVDRLCKNFGAGGLAGAAHAGKQISVAHTACGDLVAQCGHDAALGHHVLKPLGPPLAVQGSIHLLLPFQQKSRAALTGVDPRLA